MAELLQILVTVQPCEVSGRKILMKASFQRFFLPEAS